MAILLGLNGRRGAGKDTAFGYVQEWASQRGLLAARRGFADLVKLSFARLFLPDCSIDEAVNWCDTLKLPHASRLEVEWVNYNADDGQQTFVKHRINGRLALQRYGTEGHRQVFGDDFWVDALLPQEDGWARNFMGPFDQNEPDICVVTDVRFDNEARRIHALGGQIWEVYRGGLTTNDTHASEEPLTVTLVSKTIYNNAEGDPDQMREQIRVALDPVFEEASRG